MNLKVSKQVINIIQLDEPTGDNELYTIDDFTK